MLGFYVKTRVGFSLLDKRLFEITEVEITRVDYIRYTYQNPILGMSDKNLETDQL